jgi:hypothetical protein
MGAEGLRPPHQKLGSLRKFLKWSHDAHIMGRSMYDACELAIGPRHGAEGKDLGHLIKWKGGSDCMMRSSWLSLEMVASTNCHHTRCGVHAPGALLAMLTQTLWSPS